MEWTEDNRIIRLFILSTKNRQGSDTTRYRLPACYFRFVFSCTRLNRFINRIILHRARPVTSVVGYARKKGNSLHRGYNPAMKNKRSARMPTRAVRKMMPLRASRTRGARLASES